MNSFRLLLISLTLPTCLFSTNISAQQYKVSAESSFNGAAQPKPVKIPTPLYSKDAKQLGLKGSVAVLITVNETGGVSYASYASGPYPVCPAAVDPKFTAFKLAAESAARKARFKPAIVGGKPSEASGLVTYSFVPPTPRPTSNAKGMRLDRLTMIGDSGARIEPVPGQPAVLSNSGSGGVLNGKAQELPKPTYPRAAKAVRAGGPVSVRVLIYEDGSMFSAEAISGHPLLKNAAEIAACKARFSPTLLSGKPVKVSGIITYNFVP